MPVFLFHDVIFGPVRSRRLGLSLGINLLPSHSKYCSYNCIYCECGWTTQVPGDAVELPTRLQVKEFLEQRLKELAAEEYLPDAITFAGNGEPTLHPDFAGIVDDTIQLRNRYAAQAQVVVLSNASTLENPDVFHALTRLDQNIQKLDSGSDELFRLINNPVAPGRFNETIERLKSFNGQVIIQSLFLKGTFNHHSVDNTAEEEVSAWLGHISVIRPKLVMLYSLARATPSRHLENVSTADLEKIAERVRSLNMRAEVY
jgi:wyosine [tRNA(Phe)-imidazoG37] synthetase (radical SAM superfamily)